VLPELAEDDLKELGLPLGPRKLLLKAIASLPDGQADAPAPPSARAAGDAERRQLTILFCDLVGSTELSARLDPEDMREVISAYQKAVAGEIARYDGHVAKFMGDGVLAYFGWPRAHEEEAERAVRAGLAITDAVGRLTTPCVESLAARIGIATGLVVVGDLIGDDEARERAVVGETPNLAARLQAVAESGGVVIAESTRRLVGDLFEYIDLGTRDFKGFAEPMRVWQVIGAGVAESRFEALRVPGLVPMVGREQEIALIVDRWALANSGDGQVVLLSGEAGIGKSRIAHALLEHIGDEPHTQLRYYCSPYHSNSALHPVIGQLERAAGIESDDDAEAKLDKVEAFLGDASVQLAEVVPLLALLLSIPTEGRYPTLDLTPQAQKTKTFEVLLRQLVDMARHQPVLMLFEDAHWIDPTTTELLGLVMERMQDMSLLLLITSRPEFTAPWTSHAHTTSLTLNRLGRHQGAALVRRLTGGKPLPAEVLGQILARTEGVPLFVEELTKTVLESGLLQEQSERYLLTGPLPSVAIPSTLHDSLMARLDRLESVKEIAQIGAVIGREFSHELLSAAAEKTEREAAIRARKDNIVWTDF